MPAMFSSEPIRIGVVANEPMRLEGLTSIFENHARPGEPPLLPVVGTLEEHLDNDAIARRLQLSAGTLRTALSRAQARHLGEVRRLAPEFFPDRG